MVVDYSGLNRCRGVHFYKSAEGRIAELAVPVGYDPPKHFGVREVLVLDPTTKSGTQEIEFRLVEDE